MPIVLGGETANLEEPRELKAVTLVCQWTAQAQFAGYYMAKEKGFYRKYGLDVIIRHADPNVGNTRLLEQHKAQFATMFLTTAIKLHSTGVPVVNIAQFSRRSSLLIVARKSAGIKNVRDLNGKRIGIWFSDFQDIPLRFLSANNIDAKVIMTGSGINMFLFGGVDAINITSYNELHLLIMAGIPLDKLTIFRLREHGLDIPEDGLYCMSDFYNKNQKLCRDFVQASREGWRYAVSHQQETLDVLERLVREQRLPLTRRHQQWMLREIMALFFPAGTDTQSVSLNRETYYNTAEVLKKAGTIKNIARYDDFCRENN